MLLCQKKVVSLQADCNSIRFYVEIVILLICLFVMAQNIFKGLGIALVTPFTADGEVDYPSLKRLVDYQLQNGADFLCIQATTGETPCLTAEEKHQIKQLVVELAGGRVPILMGCGGNNTAAVVDQLRTGDFSGIDGVLSVCPYYNKPSQEGLYQHFRAIAEASPLPVVLYNVPGRTGVNLKSSEHRCHQRSRRLARAGRRNHQAEARPFRRPLRRRRTHLLHGRLGSSRSHLRHRKRIAKRSVAHDTPRVQRRIRARPENPPPFHRTLFPPLRRRKPRRR